MKNRILLLVLLIKLTVAYSQDSWVEKGSFWKYESVNGVYSTGHSWVKYERDTLIDGKIAQVFEIQRYADNEDCTSFTGVYYSYTAFANDTVYRWNGSKWKLFLDFSANVGDSWQVHDGPIDTESGCESSIVEIIDKGIINISGQDFEYIELHKPNDSNYGMWGTYVKGIGKISGILGSLTGPGSIPCGYQFWDWTRVSFRYFANINSNIVFNPSNMDLLCHDLNVTVNFKIFPNPVNTLLNIKADSNCDFIIKDLNGSTILKTETKDYEFELDVSCLNVGSYFICVESQDYNCKRFIKI